MEPWRITIDGVGPFHTGRSEIDADLMAKNLLRYLRANHEITDAQFTTPTTSEAL